MKKLMILAAVAVMGGAVMAACEEGAKCVFAYKLTMSGKTVVGQATKGKASQCIDPTCIAVPGKIKTTGYIYGTTEDLNDPDQCVAGCGCNDFTTTEAVLLDKKAKMIVPTAVEFDTIDVIGKKQNTVQVLAKIGEVTLAGQGKVKKGTISSVKGNFAGSMDAPVCSTCTYDASDCSETCDETPAIVGKLCSIETAPAEKSVVFGKWSMKNSKSAAKKLTKNYDPTVLAKGYTLAQS